MLRGGEIDSPAAPMCHVTNGAVGQGANGGRSPPVEYPLPTFFAWGEALSRLNAVGQGDNGGQSPLSQKIEMDFDEKEESSESRNR